MLPSNFSHALKDYRDKNTLTQPQMASLCGVSHRTYCDWESGRCKRILPVTMEGTLARLGLQIVSAAGK